MTALDPLLAAIKERPKLIRRHGLATTLSPELRLLAGREINANGCWIWMGARCRLGYGHIWSGRIRRATGVHLLAWELLEGVVPPGLELDHLCSNRACFNPAHLEPVTHAVNIQRGHARRGTTRASPADP